jgi:hypothetical protein
MDILNSIAKDESAVREKAHFVLQNVNLLPEDCSLLHNVHRFAQQQQQQQQAQPHETPASVAAISDDKSSAIVLNALTAQLQAKEVQIQALKRELANSDRRAGMTHNNSGLI